MFGGEACDPDCVREVLKNGSAQRLLHVYGPTESTTFASWHLIENVPEGATTIPIGRPISNTTLYILDRDLHPVPLAFTAKCISAAMDWRAAYWRREELTTERFISIAECGLGWRNQNGESAIPHSAIRNFIKLATSRVILPDGSIEFIGRKDHQIKLRGFRIELGEIEAALLAHPAIQESVVAVTESPQHDKRLIAYYVAPATRLRPVANCANFSSNDCRNLCCRPSFAAWTNCR